MRIAPQPGGGFTHATLSRTTVHGDVMVGWRITGDTIAVDVTIPACTGAMVVLSLHPDGLSIDVAGGSHTWTDELPEGHASGPSCSLDMPYRILAADPAEWNALTRAFAERLPAIPFAHAARRNMDASPRTALGHFPPAAS
ncbi:alpha-L-rhamnosidase C-terminal domain-containing protein [Streptomyces sp. NPDC050149]|uniref:alpha-L-rhamnosidase C-terminal domain-containing protein n=1 Tax=Streptomyces sp. NPDC050149 TaxID=3365603 RepID=UPI00379889D2